MTPKGSQTRRRIVEQALQLFSVKGYYNTSISDIQEATGLTKGGLYGHFASKEDIWYAVYDEAVEIWKGIVFKGIRSHHDPLEQSRELSSATTWRPISAARCSMGAAFFSTCWWS